MQKELEPSHTTKRDVIIRKLGIPSAKPRTGVGMENNNQATSERFVNRGSALAAWYLDRPTRAPLAAVTIRLATDVVRSQHGASRNNYDDDGGGKVQHYYAPGGKRVSRR